VQLSDRQLQARITLHAAGNLKQQSALLKSDVARAVKSRMPEGTVTVIRRGAHGNVATMALQFEIIFLKPILFAICIYTFSKLV
jgi:hypothetical protein